MADLLRIPEGISGRRPRQDPLFYFETLHRELYHQIATQIRGRYRLVLDLHCGIDEGGPCADLISCDPELLARIEERAFDRFGGTGENQPVHAALLGDSAMRATPAKTVIPRDFWKDSDFEYVGLEVYLSSPGVGNPSDREFALWLIRSVIEHWNSVNAARLV